MTGDYKKDGTGFEGIEYMLCRPETEFFPDLSKVRESPRLFALVSFSAAPRGPLSRARGRRGEEGGAQFALIWPGLAARRRGGRGERRGRRSSPALCC